jgi:hypothetical protein
MGELCGEDEDPDGEDIFLSFFLTVPDLEVDFFNCRWLLRYDGQR